MDIWDKLLIIEWIFILFALTFAYTVLAPIEKNTPPQEAMEKMRLYVEETGIQMQDVELILREHDLYPDNRSVNKVQYSYINYKEVAGYAQYAGNESQILMRGDFDRKIGILSHEYAHQVMYAKGIWEGHHDMPEFWWWENCLYFSTVFNTNLCK